MTPTTPRQPGRPVMLDVARHAGVSLKTVSRVINGEPNVRPVVRDRVRRAIDELGYRPNVAARTLAARSTRVIGVVVLGSSLLYGPASQMFGVERAAWAAGYSVVVSSLAETTTEELVRAVRELVDHGVDGIAIAAPVHLAPLDMEALLQTTPAVSLDQFPEDMGLPTVISDQRAGARAATEHLLQIGHETVWHVSGPSSWHATRERVAGWLEALERAGAPVPDVVEGDWSAGTGYAVGRALAARPEVTAVFAANDHTAMGVMRAFFEAGRHIPGDVSVVGFDDVPEAEHLLVPLTTVHQDFAATTRVAVEKLTAMLHERRHPTPDLTSVPVELRVRASSGPPHQERRPRAAGGGPTRTGKPADHSTTRKQVVTCEPPDVVPA